MADQDERKAKKIKEEQGVEAPDQLSPEQARQDSVGGSRSQRLGDSGPVANPIVSFPDDPKTDD